MRRRTTLVLVVAAAALLGVAGFALAGGDGGTLTEEWVSDTARGNVHNHHAVGTGAGMVVAPVAARPGNEPIEQGSCVLARLAPDTGAVEWRVGVPPEACFTHALSEPAIADLDGDGTPEIAVTTAEETLVVYEADGSERFRVPLSTIGYPRPTVADLDGDGDSEVVAADIGGEVTVVEADGSVRWRVPLDESTFAPPVVADVDADGDREVVVGTLGGITVFGPTGTVELTADHDGEYLAVAQLDGDAPLEFVGSATSSLRAYDGRTGLPAWTTEVEGTPRFRDVVDGDDDGTLEVYVGYSGGRVASVDATTGRIEWTTRVSTDRPPANAPVVGDLDGDGTHELVVATRDGTVSVLSAADGRELAAYERAVPVWVAPTLGVDDDGSVAIYVRYGDGRVVKLDYRS